MTFDVDALAGAWRAAAADLGLTVRAPSTLPTGDPCIAWVADFGSPRGTLVAGLHSPSETTLAAAKSQGLYCSKVNEDAYSNYDRELFVETLNDWGWFGDLAATPTWYTG